MRKAAALCALLALSLAMPTIAPAQEATLLRRELTLQRQLLAADREQAYHDRIARYGTNPVLAWDLTYFQDKMVAPATHHSPGKWCPPAPLHFAITERLHRIEQRQARGCVLKVFRGGAKSSYVTEWWPLRLAALGLSPNTVIVGANDAKMEWRERLRNITRQIESNERLRADYPGLLPAKSPTGQLIQWNDNAIVMANGCRIGAMPVGGNARGQSYQSNRPTLWVFDDILKRQMVKQPALMREVREWIELDAAGTLAPGGHMILVGTPMAYFDILAIAAAPADEGGWGWDVLEYTLDAEAHEPDHRPGEGPSNWPSLWDDEYRAWALTLPGGARSYQKERNLQVHASEDRVFTAKDFHEFDYDGLQHHGEFRPLVQQPSEPDRLIGYKPWYARHGITGRTQFNGRWEYFGRPLTLVAHADLAVSLKETACYTALTLLGLLAPQDAHSLGLAPQGWAGPVALCLDFLRLRSSEPESLDLVEDFIRCWNPAKFGLEKQSLETALHQGLLARRKLPESLFAFVQRSNHDKTKLERVASWADVPRAQRCLFTFADEARSIITLTRLSAPELHVMGAKLLRAEAEKFPHAGFMDGLDATESAWTLASTLKLGGGSNSTGAVATPGQRSQVWG